jgi:hypothetical protein
MRILVERGDESRIDSDSAGDVLPVETGRLASPPAAGMLAASAGGAREDSFR